MLYFVASAVVSDQAAMSMLENHLRHEDGFVLRSMCMHVIMPCSFPFI